MACFLVKNRENFTLFYLTNSGMSSSLM